MKYGCTTPRLQMSGFWHCLSSCKAARTIIYAKIVGLCIAVSLMLWCSSKSYNNDNCYNWIIRMINYYSYCIIMTKQICWRTKIEKEIQRKHDFPWKPIIMSACLHGFDMFRFLDTNAGIRYYPIFVNAIIKVDASFQRLYQIKQLAGVSINAQIRNC